MRKGLYGPWPQDNCVIFVDELNLAVKIQIDGGVKLDNCAELSKLGTDVFVAGSAVFGSKDYRKTIDEMKRLIK